MSQRRTQEDFEELVRKSAGVEYTVLGRYKDALTNIYFRHNPCGRIIKMRPNRFLHEGGRCKYCNKLSRKGLDMPNTDEMQYRILVIDDDPIFLQLCKEKLACKTRIVETADRAVTGIEMYNKEPFDLVILDLLMPDMDGLEAMAKIKQEYPHSKIIMISGWDGKSQDDFKNVLKSTELLGANATLHKPFTPEELVEVAERILV